MESGKGGLVNIFLELILLKISSESRKPSSFESKERNTLCQIGSETLVVRNQCWMELRRLSRSLCRQALGVLGGGVDVV